MGSVGRWLEVDGGGWVGESVSSVIGTNGLEHLSCREDPAAEPELMQQVVQHPGWAGPPIRSDPLALGRQGPWALSCGTLTGLRFSSSEGTEWL